MLWKGKVKFNLKTNIAYSIRGILYTRNMMLNHISKSKEHCGWWMRLGLGLVRVRFCFWFILVYSINHYTACPWEFPCAVFCFLPEHRDPGNRDSLCLLYEALTRKSQLWQGLPLAVMPPGAHPCTCADSGWISFQSTSLTGLSCYSFLELIQAGGFEGWGKGIWLLWAHLCKSTWRYSGAWRRTGRGIVLQRVTQVSGWPDNNDLSVFSR